LSALHYTCQSAGGSNGKIATEIAKALLHFGANVNAIGSYLEEVRIAPATGGDPRGGNYSSGLVHDLVNITPLHYAIIAHQADLAHLLVLAGADTNITLKKSRLKTQIQETAVVALCGSDRDLLIALAAEFQPLHYNILPEILRQAIKTFLLCNERLNWGLPVELRAMIFTHLIRAHWGNTQ